MTAPPTTVKVGSTSLDIYHRLDPTKGDQWRFAYRLPGEKKWQYGTRNSLPKAKKHAREIALKINQNTTNSINHLPPEKQHLVQKILQTDLTSQELDRAIQYIHDTRHKATLAQTIPEFITFQVTESKNKKITEYIEQQQRDLNNIAEHLGPTTNVATITPAQLTKYILSLNKGKGVGAKRHNGIRSTLTKFFHHLLVAEHIPSNTLTAAQKIPQANEYNTKEIPTYTPEQTTFLLQQVTKEFLPWLVLCSFTGLRPEEISPKKKTQKPPLTTAALDFENDTIWVKRENAKGKKPKPRSMPMLPVCKAWLIHCGLDKGPTRDICIRNASAQKETLRLGKLLNQNFKAHTQGWLKDGPRHSYGSYRNALIKNLPKLSEEMGNSVAMLLAHYHEPKQVSISEKHFALTPKKVLKSSDKSKSIKTNKNL